MQHLTSVPIFFGRVVDRSEVCMFSLCHMSVTCMCGHEQMTALRSLHLLEVYSHRGVFPGLVFLSRWPCDELFCMKQPSLYSR